jgi:hypothetical protein
LSEAKTREHLHRRQITIDSYRRADGLMDVEATLVDIKSVDLYLGSKVPDVPAGDTIHGISVRLSVDAHSVIRECEVAMDSTPYSYCSEVSARFDLTGIAMTGGFMKAVAERIGHADNCWHVRQMLQQMATVFVQSSYPELRAEIEKLPPAQRPAPALINSCVGWQSHRSHIREDFPAAYRPADLDSAP